MLSKLLGFYKINQENGAINGSFDQEAVKVESQDFEDLFDCDCKFINF